MAQEMDLNLHTSTTGIRPKSVDAIGIFLREVRRTGRLTKEEEASLLKSYMGGLKAQKKQEKGDTTAQTLTLVECGIEAKQKLITSHLPLAVALARSFYRTNKRHVDFEDLVGAANEGLTEALNRFDPKMGTRFGTYAAWWIKNRIREQIKQNRWTMRIPDRIYRMVIKPKSCVKSRGFKALVSLSYAMRISKQSPVDRWWAWPAEDGCRF